MNQTESERRYEEQCHEKTFKKAGSSTNIKMGI